MDSRKLILGFYLTCSMLLWFMTRSSLSWAFAKFYQLRRIAGATAISEGVPVLLAATLFFILLKNSKVNTFLEDAVSELKKVTWPSKDDVVKSTTVVIGCILLASFVIAGFDFIWGKAIGVLIHPKTGATSVAGNPS